MDKCWLDRKPVAVGVNLRAEEMPWQWLTKIAKPRGRTKRYLITVNGKTFLRTEANNPVKLLMPLMAMFPSGASVKVARI